MTATDQGAGAESPYRHRLWTPAPQAGRRTSWADDHDEGQRHDGGHGRPRSGFGARRPPDHPARPDGGRGAAGPGRRPVAVHDRRRAGGDGGHPDRRCGGCDRPRRRGGTPSAGAADHDGSRRLGELPRALAAATAQPAPALVGPAARRPPGESGTTILSAAGNGASATLGPYADPARDGHDPRRPRAPCRGSGRLGPGGQASGPYRPGTWCGARREQGRRPLCRTEKGEQAAIETRPRWTDEMRRWRR